jgi:hypothetical protein
MWQVDEWSPQLVKVAYKLTDSIKAKKGKEAAHW